MQEAARDHSRTSEFRPQVFGKHYLLQRLAVGGMAEIYRAKIVGAGGFEKELVVKRILPNRSQDQAFIKMLVNEARLTGQLTHDNIAQIYECDAVEGTYFIAMELVHGVSMKDMMTAFARAGVQLSPEQSVYLVLQLLQGLDYAHRKVDAEGRPLKIVHCDVSPDNALVSYEGEVKLLDFGIARAATGLSNYKEGMLMGKLGYVAPEQASLETKWDHRVDIFAAGIILYELLTKQKPFPRAADVESLIESRKTKVLAPSAFDDRLPKELDAIVARALSYDPERRYPRARAFADALVDVLFPTPHSTIQDLIGQQMQQVYADRIAKQRAARAHDALVMKVLQNVAAKDSDRLLDSQPGVHRLDDSFLDVEVAAARAGARARPSPASAPEPLRKMRSSLSTLRAVALGGLAGALVGGAFFGAEIYTRTGSIVVTSDPPGAEVQVDGHPASPTPSVVEKLLLREPHTVTVSAPDRKTFTRTLPADVHRESLRIHAPLPLAVSDLVLESDPPGAEVRLDGRLLGLTPVTAAKVTIGERHRIDMTYPGKEIDQFVVLPEKDGTHFRRTLAPAKPAAR